MFGIGFHVGYGQGCTEYIFYLRYVVRSTVARVTLILAGNEPGSMTERVRKNSDDSGHQASYFTGPPSERKLQFLRYTKKSKFQVVETNLLSLTCESRVFGGFDGHPLLKYIIWRLG